MQLRLVMLLTAASLAAQTRLPPKQTAPPPPASHERPKTAAAPAHSRSAGPAASASDKDIESAFRQKLAKSKIAADKFTIRVQGGVATLEGQTEVVQHKGTATRMAKSAGARTVVNNIRVSDAAREKASENLSKGRRRAQVKRSEVAHRN